MNHKKSLRNKGVLLLNRSKSAGYIKTGLFSIAVLLVIAYNILLTPSICEKIVKSQFEKRSHGKINLHIVQSSLLRGFIIEKLEISSGADFDKLPLIKIDRINILYSVFGFFAGDFGFHEIGFYNPRVYLYQKNGVWNVSRLMKKSEKAEEKKESEDNKISQDGLSLPFSIRGFLKFVLQDFILTISDMNHDGDTLETGVKNFTLRTYILTRKFNYIPYSLAAADIFKSVFVNLDPQKTIDIYFKNQSTRLKSPMDFHWLLTFDNNMKKEGFYSRLIVGHQSIPVEYRGKHILPLNLGMDYDLKYDPSTDRINLKYFRLSFLNDVWVNLAGVIERPADTSKTALNLSITKSDIDIGKVLPYYHAFTGNHDLVFRGNISLAPMRATGTLNNLLLDGRLSFYRLFVHAGSRDLDLDSLDFYYHTIIDKDIVKALIPKVKIAKIRWSGIFNDAPLGAEISYKLNEDINVFAYVNRFNPEPFSSDTLSGFFNAEMRIKGKNQKKLIATLELDSPGFTYYVERGASGINQMNLFVKSEITFPEDGFSTLEVSCPEINFRLNNQKNQKALLLAATMEASKSPDNISLRFNIAELAANIKNLGHTLPGTYREKLEFYFEKSEKDIRIKGLTTFRKTGESMLAENTTRFFVDDLAIDDVFFKTKYIKEGQNITIPYLTLKGLNNALDVSIKGNLVQEYRNVDVESESGNITEEKKLTWIPDITYGFKLGRGQKIKMFKEQTISGYFNLSGSARDNMLHGNLVVDKLYYDNGNFMRVNNANMNFPYHHDRRYKKTLNLTAASKERLIKNFAGDFKYNFTIDSIEIPNPTHKNEPLAIVYSRNGTSGLSAAMRYKDNVFEMPMMQIFMLNGLTSIQDTVVNVGRSNRSEMQYRTLMQVKDIDLKQLIPAEKAQSIKDGKISADVLLSASSLRDFISDTSGYVSIYKIGKQFANQAVKIVLPDSSPMVNFAVDEGTIVNKMDIEFKEGLAYAKILYSKGIVGQLFGFAGNQIIQERRPVAELFQKAGEEVKIYQNVNPQNSRPGDSD